MSERSEVLQVLRQWVQKAEQDLRVAEHLLASADPCVAEAVCFHAQQCVEKYAKAVLALNDIDPPKIHDIGAMLDQLPEFATVDLDEPARRRLTKYATLIRYPGTYDPVTLDEARAAVELARRARACLRQLLPTETLDL